VKSFWISEQKTHYKIHQTLARNQNQKSSKRFQITISSTLI